MFFTTHHQLGESVWNRFRASNKQIQEDGPWIRFLKLIFDADLYHEPRIASLSN